MSSLITCPPDHTGVFVDNKHLQLVQLLSSGDNSKVYKALITTSSPDDPKYYAVKCMRNYAKGSDKRDILSTEFHLHNSVAKQPGVISFEYFFEDGRELLGVKHREFVFVVMPLCDGDMESAIVKRRAYVDRPGRVREAFTELLEAVGQSHARGVFHGDLQPANILCDSAGTGIRLVDFGCATRDPLSHTSRRGNLAYNSPECADTRRTRPSHSPRQSDLWALAVVLLKMLTGTTAWAVADPSDAAYAAFRSDEYNFFVERYRLTRATNEFFRWCFAADVDARPTLSQMKRAFRALPSFVVVPVAAPLANASAAVDLIPCTDGLISDLPAPSPSTEPAVAFADLLDAPNVGFAAVNPAPLVPMSLNTPASPSPPPTPAPVKPTLLERQRRDVATRARLVNKLRRRV
ncbi:kinase-like domain-containing protein [Mycena epipterygia]|nr:kinase-like domain-containing protein [Mycena epipterygia]KAJ7095634.1 kinase-like domain-containing protein [Mycena epipterygia]